MFDISKDHKIISANDNAFKWQAGHAYNLSGKWLGPCSLEMVAQVTKNGDVEGTMLQIMEEAKKAKAPEEANVFEPKDKDAGLRVKARVIGKRD